MARERYRLAKQVNGRFAYAEVEVSAAVVEQGMRSVVVSDHVFAWLKDVYGPDAWEWAVCDEYRKAAIEGAHVALDHASPAVEAAVVIERIRAAPADSSAETIAYAAAQATWRALDVRPTKALQIYGVELPG